MFFLPFRMAAILVTEYGYSIYVATPVEMLTQLFGRCLVIHLTKIKNKNIIIIIIIFLLHFRRKQNENPIPISPPSLESY